jgi:hypothetical protein
MKLLLSTLITLVIFIGSASAQTTPAPNVTVKGVLVDSVTKAPMSFVTITLKDAKTGQAIRAVASRDNGAFTVKAAPNKSYQLALVFIGYKNKTIKVTVGDHDADLGKLLMLPTSQGLKEVSITATKPLVKQEIDRISYDVQADPETKTQNVLDMLRKVPLLTIDANDNIQLKGNSNYKILINGKESSLVAHNPSDVFKSMPASSIQKIEVITTPPAKYDAEGLTGIINIITNKKVDQGYNASINMRYNSVYGPGGGASLTLKEGKFGFSMYTGGSDRRAVENNSRTSLQTFGNFPSDLEQSSTGTNTGHFLYTSEQLSYEIDTLNLITATIDANGARFNNNNDLLSQTFDPSSGLLTQSYRQTSLNSNSWNGFDVGFNYQLGFKGNKDRLLTLSYKYSNSPNSIDGNIDVFDRFNYGVPSLQQLNKTGTREHTFQADYVHPLKKLNIEGGVKAILRNNFSNFNTGDLDTATHAYVDNTADDNDFNYKQDIYSIYNTYQLNLDNWAFKGGVRIENTVVHADFLTVNTPVNQNYTNVIPSVSVSRIAYKGQGSIS